MIPEEKKQNHQEIPSDFDYEAYQQKVIAGLIQGKPLTGDGGLLKPLIAKFVQGALDAELSAYLSEEKTAGESNRRNGKVSKKIRTESGDIPIEYSRDRNSSFEPITVKKRTRPIRLGL